MCLALQQPGCCSLDIPKCPVMEGAAESKSITSGSTGMSPVPLSLEEIIPAREREPEECAWMGRAACPAVFRLAWLSWEKPRPCKWQFM